MKHHHGEVHLTYKWTWERTRSQQLLPERNGYERESMVAAQKIITKLG
jgi:hypothetical protein